MKYKRFIPGKAAICAGKATKRVAETHYRTEGYPTPNDETLSTHSYAYDPNGNLTGETVARKRRGGNTTSSVSERRLLWDGTNRLRAVSDNGYVSLYWYDADGNHTVMHK